METPRAKLVFRDPRSLIPYEKNSKVHTPEQVAKIADQIAAFGFDQPIVVDKDGVIIKGHGRREAAISLDLPQVPVVVAEHLSKKQAKAARIADNKVNESPWDVTNLKIELAELQLDDFDVHLTGFDVNALSAPELVIFQAGSNVVRAPVAPVVPMGGGAAETRTDVDDIPEAPSEPITQPGNVWFLGEHILMCGDATDPEVVARLMKDREPDMVFTDPPYGMFLDTNFSSMDGLRVDGTRFLKGLNGGKKYRPIIGDGKDFKAALITSVFEAFPKCQEIFLWGADYYADLLPNRNSGSWVVWDKRTNDEASAEQASSADRLFGSSFELCWSKSKHKREIARIRNGIFGVRNESGNSKTVHPTQKPVQLVEWFFEKWGEVGDLVVDLFGGSGTTLIACQRRGRVCRMLELDPGYCDIIVRRWENYTGLKAVLTN